MSFHNYSCKFTGKYTQTQKHEENKHTHINKHTQEMMMNKLRDLIQKLKKRKDEK